MKAMVIIESWFGNTRAIGEEIARGLEAQGAHVEIMSVEEAPSAIPADVGLLVIGAPTHSRSLSTVATREKAAEKAKGAGSAGNPTGRLRRGVREWLGETSIPDSMKIAVYDTVTGKNWMSGSAAKAAAKILRSRSPEAAVEVRSFVVRAVAGPLADGEIEAAQHWAHLLATS